MTPIPLYWWRDRPNFGDALSPWIVERLLETRVRWSKRRKKLVALGSVLWAARRGDVVWGSGVHPSSPERHPAWSPAGVRFLAVRGPLTRDYVAARGGDAPAIFGDPGELLPYFHRPEPRVAVGVGAVLHIDDDEGARFVQSRPAIRRIDASRPWREVVEAIVSCERVWSSSLHGIIVAEAYGVPAVWTACGEGRLKYDDYYAATGRSLDGPVSWDAAPTAVAPPPPTRVPLEEHPLAAALWDWRREATPCS